MKRLVFSLCAAWLVFPASAMAQTRYAIADFAPSGPFTNSAAYGINDNGFVTGTCSEQSAYGSSRAVLWDNVHTMHDLGALGEEENSWGYGLNDNLMVVGEGTHIWYHTAIFCTYPFAFERLVTTGDDDSRAYAVSNSTMIVGQRDNRPYEFWQQEYFDSRDGAAYDVNDKNYAVGYVTIGTSPTEKDIGKLWNYPTGVPVRTMNPAAGFLKSKAHGINEDGDLVVGSSWDETVSLPYKQVACVWKENESTIIWDAIPLPNLYDEGDQWSYASEVNNSGTIVGYWTDDLLDDLEKRACVWVEDSSGDYQIYDLNELVDDWYNEWTLIEAVDINESGQIVGLMARYVGDDYEYHGFLLNPVPEPAASAMLALPALLGTSGLLMRRFARRRLRHALQRHAAAAD